MLSCIQSELSVFICFCSYIVRCIEWNGGKRAQMCSILFKEFTDEAAIAVFIMFTLHVCFAAYQEPFILLCEVIKPRDWDKMVPAQVTYFIFHISLFPSRFRIAKTSLEAVMR